MYHPHYRAPVFHHPLRVVENGEDVRIGQAYTLLNQVERQADGVLHTLQDDPPAEGVPSSTGAHSRLGACESAAMG